LEPLRGAAIHDAAHDGTVARSAPQVEAAKEIDALRNTVHAARAQAGEPAWT